MKKRLYSLGLSLVILFTMIFTADLSAQAATPYSKICSDEEWEVLKRTNKKRLESGLEPLSTFSKLQSVSGIRAKEITSYFSHTRPNGNRCFTALDGEEIKYFVAGENIAAGQNSPEEVVTTWWGSSGHKANILRDSFEHLGVGYNIGGRYRKNWVQMFIGGCETTEILVSSSSKVGKYKKGTSIEKMNRYVAVKCNMHGTSYMPLTDKMCSGFNKNKTGVQTVKLSYNGCKTSFKVLIENIKPAKVVSLKSTKVSKNSVALSWKKSSNASGYEVYRATSKNGQYKRTATIKKGSTVKYTNRSLKSNKKYYYKVRAYSSTNNIKTYGSFSSILTVKTAKR